MAKMGIVVMIRLYHQVLLPLMATRKGTVVKEGGENTLVVIANQGIREITICMIQLTIIHNNNQGQSIIIMMIWKSLGLNDV